MAEPARLPHGRPGGQAAAGNKQSTAFPRESRALLVLPGVCQLQGAAVSQLVSWAHDAVASQVLEPPSLAM